MCIRDRASNDVASLADTFNLRWDIAKEVPNLVIEPEEEIILEAEVQETPVEEITIIEKEVEVASVIEEGDIVLDSAFKIKSKPKPNKQVLITALEDTLTDRIDSITSYSVERSAFIQVGAFRKFNVSQTVADDIAQKIGKNVEVRPTLVSEPIMYRILVGPEHKDEIIDVIADLMELGISDFFLAHG